MHIVALLVVKLRATGGEPVILATAIDYGRLPFFQRWKAKEAVVFAGRNLCEGLELGKCDSFPFRGMYYILILSNIWDTKSG